MHIHNLDEFSLEVQETNLQESCFKKFKIQGN